MWWLGLRNNRLRHIDRLEGYPLRPRCSHLQVPVPIPIHVHSRAVSLSVSIAIATSLPRAARERE
jgi:hypothetical protein